MRNLFPVRPFVLLAAIVLVCASELAWAAPNGRSLVASRQAVQAEVAAAMADGTITSPERYKILVMARQRLSRSEFAGIREKLDRLSGRRQMPIMPIPDAFSDASPTPTDENTSLVAMITENEIINDDVEESTDNVAFIEPAEPLPAPEPEQDPFDEENYDPAYSDDVVTPDTSEGYYADGFADDFTGVCAGGCGPWCNIGTTCCGARGHVRLSTGIEAFKGPLDLDNQNGNFGVSFAVNGGFPLFDRWGIGVQAGTSAVLTNFHGTQFTGDEVRSQNFTTVGMFQGFRTRFGGNLKWGFAFDWYFDYYYEWLVMSQWRVQLAYELNWRHEIGLWACIPNDGDDAELPAGVGVPAIDRFEPIGQGNFYYRRNFANAASLMGYVGIIEEPGEVVFGGRVRMPFSSRLSVIGNFNYVEPSTNGVGGQDEEMWHVGLGIEFVPGRCGNRCQDRRFTPLMPLADNGLFAIKRK